MMMWLFSAVSGLLVIAVLLLILPPLLRRSRTRLSRDALNAAVYRDQLRELEEDVAVGTLSHSGYEEGRREIESRLLEDVGGEHHASSSPAGPRWHSALAIGVGTSSSS